jgi:DNA-binding MarR family transcriptional regulator
MVRTGVLTAMWLFLGVTDTIVFRDSRGNILTGPMAKKNKAKFSVEESHAYYIYSIQAASYAKLADVVRPLGLTTPAWRVIAVLQEKDGISVRDLAQRTVIDVSNLSKLITAMSGHGLVTKKRSTEDARVMLVCITEQGRKTFEAAVPAVRQVLDHNLEGFSDNERDRFRFYLQRMMQNVGSR